MAVSSEAYVPLLVSEKLSRNPNGQLDLCRAAVLAMLLNTGTDGEWMTKPNGRDWGKKRMTKLLEGMRKATGDPARGSYNQGHVSSFVRGADGPTDAYEVANAPWAAIVAGLEVGKWCYDLAGDVRDTPEGSPLRKYVNPDVGHDIFLLKISKDGERIAFIDPMTPPGTKNYVRWAPTSHFRQFAQRFMYGSNRRVVAGRVKKGYYSEANKVRRNKQGALEEQRVQILELKQQVVSKQAKLQALRDDLALCNEQEDPNVIERLEADLDIALDQLSRIKAVASE